MIPVSVIQLRWQASRTGAASWLSMFLAWLLYDSVWIYLSQTIFTVSVDWYKQLLKCIPHNWLHVKMKLNG